MTTDSLPLRFLLATLAGWVTLVSAADCREVDVGVSASGVSWAHEGDRGAHRADGDGESRLGLQPHPGGVEESRPPRREKHGRQGSQGPWDSACARAAFIVAD